MTKLNGVDKAALELAVETARKKHGRAQQIADKLKEEPWRDVAEFCALVCQGESLDLKPWMVAPCEICDPDKALQVHHDGRREAAALLKTMLALGVSRWHPDPLAAIAAASQVRSIN